MNRRDEVNAKVGLGEENNLFLPGTGIRIVRVMDLARGEFNEESRPVLEPGNSQVIRSDKRL